MGLSLAVLPFIIETNINLVRSIYLFITCLRWRTLEVPFTIAWSLTDAYIAWTLKS